MIVPGTIILRQDGQKILKILSIGDIITYHHYIHNKSDEVKSHRLYNWVKEFNHRVVFPFNVYYKATK